MAEVAATPRPRIALAYGDAADVAPLRAALAGAVDVVYASPAAAFDMDCLAGLEVVAVLVSLDGDDWLEPLAGRAERAGIRLVLDDPSISGTLEGWARARWLRHLAAKLAGSSDYDPPRPTPAAAAVDRGVDAPAGSTIGADTGGDALERAGELAPFPTIALALHEEGDMVAAGEHALDGARAGRPDAAPKDTPPMELADGLATAGAPLELEPVPVADGPEGPLELDPDTAALSALIDSQLAEPAGGTSQAPNGVWRIPQSGATPPVKPDGGPDAAGLEPALAADTRRRPHPVSDPVDEAEVLKGLPSVDDWQLVDPAAAVAPAPKAAPAVSAAPAAIDIGGLSLVPMEEAAAIERHSDPIERWMDTAERVGAAAEAARRQRAGKDRSGT